MATADQPRIQRINGLLAQLQREVAALSVDPQSDEPADIYDWFCSVWPYGLEADLWRDFPMILHQFNDGPRLLRANLQSWLDNDSQTRAGCRWARSFLKSGVWQRPCQQAGAKPQRRRDAFDELLEGQQ